MSSPINLDLDFQDYTPSASAGGQASQFIPQTGEAHVRIPSPAGSTSGRPGRNPQRSRSLLNLLQNATSAAASREGLSEETLQQLLWMSSKQKSRQSKGSNAISGNWLMNYLAQYFDTTSNDVLQRIVWSAVPLRKTGIDIDDLTDSELTAPLADSSSYSFESGDRDNILEQLGNKRKQYSYMERFIQSRPDMYGPFWISATLIFAVAIFSNLASFVAFKSKVDEAQTVRDKLLASASLNGLGNGSLSDAMIGPDPLDSEWHYSMDELNTTASVVMFYVTLMPTLLWFLFWSRGCPKYYTLTETICAYGYSLSAFIPLSALLMVQTLLFRYIVLLLASLLSGLVLVMSFLPMIHSDPSIKGPHIVLAIVPVCHVGLAYVLHRIMLQ